MHDYDPGWDYRTIRRPHEPALDAAERQIAARLLPTLGLSGMTLFFVRRGQLGGGRIALYVAGTASAPAIGLDIAAHRALRRAGTPLETTIAASLAHELAHAFLESAGVDPDDHDEDAVEDFARDFVHTGAVRTRGLLADHRPPEIPGPLAGA